MRPIRTCAEPACGMSLFDHDGLGDAITAFFPELKGRPERHALRCPAGKCVVTDVYFESVGPTS